MGTIHLVYEKGVFRPTTPVDLPEGTAILIELLPPSDPASSPMSWRGTYRVLGRASDTVDSHLSERHDEHQP